MKSLATSLKVQPDKLEARVASMAEEQRKLASEVDKLKVCTRSCCSTCWALTR